MGEDAAWMLCEEILTKAGEEFFLQALDLLHDEVNAKRIAVNAQVITTPDQNEELERDKLVLSNLLEREEEIRSKYMGYMNESASSSLDPAMVARSEDARKFLLALGQMSMLVNYKHMMSHWIEEVRKRYRDTDPARIVAETAMADPKRLEMLRYMLKNKKFVEQEVFKEEERNTLARALLLTEALAKEGKHDKA